MRSEAVRKRRACFVASLFALGLLACVTDERDDAARAEKAYRECVALHPRSSPACASLEERMLAAQRRYQERSRRAWACDPAQEQCPTPR
jgi:hypothetical protein